MKLATEKERNICKLNKDNLFDGFYKIFHIYKYRGEKLLK